MPGDGRARLDALRVKGARLDHEIGILTEELHLAHAVEAAAIQICRTGAPYSGVDSRVRDALANGGICNARAPRSISDLEGVWCARGTAKGPNGQPCDVVENIYLTIDASGQIVGAAPTKGGGDEPLPVGAEFVIESGTLSGAAIDFFQRYTDGSVTTWRGNFETPDTFVGEWTGECEGHFRAQRCSICETTV